MSHKMTNKGKVKILYNSISDKEGEKLYPYLETQHQHMAGATYLVSKDQLDSGKYKWEEVIGPPAVSVTTRDIFEDIEASTIVIKIDVEGHECKVNARKSFFHFLNDDTLINSILRNIDNPFIHS